MNLPAIAIVVCACGEPLLAQAAPASPSYMLGLAAGPSPHRFSGSGTGFALQLEFDIPVHPAIVVAPGLTVYWYEPARGGATSMAFLDVSGQVHPVGGAVRPYAGAGAGLAEPPPFLDPSMVLSAHGLVGVLVPLSGRVLARGEVRWRAIELWGRTRDMVLGVAVRL